MGDEADWEIDKMIGLYDGRDEFGDYGFGSPWRGRYNIGNGIHKSLVRHATDNTPLPKKVTMKKTPRLAQLEAQKERLEANIKAEKKRIKEFGPEPDVGEVVKFQKRFNNSGPWYLYAAIRTSVGWFVTGSSSRGAMSYASLIDFIKDSDQVYKTDEDSWEFIR